MSGTNVPPPSFGPNGFVSPTASAILTGAQADIDAAMGGGLNPDLTTPQGQLASSLSAIIEDSNGQFTALANGVDPAYATGRMQDAIGRIAGITRIPGTPTTLTIQCNGAAELPIPVGLTIIDDSQNQYQCNATATIGAGGSVTTTFACTVDGPIPVPATNSVRLYQILPGLDSVTCTGGAVGTNIESRAAFELRRQASVALNALGYLGPIKAAILEQVGVIDAYVTENDENTVQTIGGVAVLPNSILAAVTGGAAGDIAAQIYDKKSPGCNMTGWQTVTIFDQSPGYTQPYPAYEISFKPALTTPIVFTVTLKNNPQVPSNVTALVQGALAAALAGADCTFLGSISGTTLTVTTIYGGALTPGQSLFGPQVLPYNAIVAQLTGPPGGVGTYQVSLSQTVASETMATGPVNPLQVTTRAGQGATVYASDYYAPIMALGPWVQIVSIQIGLAPGDPTPSLFTANAVGTGLTIDTISGGAVAVGQFIYDIPTIPYGTSISAYGTGQGETGTYTLSASVASTGTVSMFTTCRLPAANFDAAINAGTLNVSSVNGGTLDVGQFVFGTSVPPGAIITALGSGTGGTGTYIISTPGTLTVGGENMYSVTANQNVVTFNVDEFPSLQEGNVNVVLS